MIEDDPVTSEAIREGLEEEGFQVTVALDGHSGLTMAQHLFGLILLDIMLPSPGGWQVCRRLRKLLAGQTSSLVIDFKLAEFQLVGSVLRPTVGAGDGSQNSGEGCIGHLDGTVANLVAGTGFDLQTANGRTIKVTLSSATTVVSGQTGSADTLADGQSVHVEGAFDPTAQTVTATTVTLNDYTSTQHERATGTVASVNAPAGSFVLTINRADGLQPTGGTITVQTSSATAFLKTGHTAGTLADVTAGATVDTSGTFDAASQTLTARFVSLH